jgi:hypothetical protein
MTGREEEGEEVREEVRERSEGGSERVSEGGSEGGRRSRRKLGPRLVPLIQLKSQVIAIHMYWHSVSLTDLVNGQNLKPIPGRFRCRAEGAKVEGIWRGELVGESQEQSHRQQHLFE